MASKVSIANQALTWLGANTITAFTDNSDEAKLVSANYDGVRDAVLEDAAWTFASRRVVLTPALAPPDFGFKNQFLIPPDTLRIRTVRNDGMNSGPSNLDWVLEDRRILSDAARIYVKYLARVDDPSQYSPLFIQAIAARLAADLAIPVTGSRMMQSDMWGLYQKKLSDAKARDGMQGRAQKVGKKKWASVRGAAGTGSVAGPIV